MIINFARRNFNKMLLSMSNVTRALGIAKKFIKNIQVWLNIVAVKLTTGKLLFVSWATLKEAFAGFRASGSEAVEFVTTKFDRRDGGVAGVATAAGSNAEEYDVVVSATSNNLHVGCTCKDFDRQIQDGLRGICKHGIALLNIIGADPDTSLLSQVL